MQLRKSVLYTYVACILIFACIYYSLGTSHFNSGMKKGSFVDNLYFSVITMSTVGYGDIVPVSQTARLLATLQSFLVIVFIMIILFPTDVMDIL